MNELTLDIDFDEAEKINEKALKALVREAVALNEVQSQALIDGCTRTTGLVWRAPRGDSNAQLSDP